eukprot:TRINITY_DN26332_c0_g1_i1.p1 TRINITY_DN26332_c0_g1~~TRINITY_DN26332_c0_g1_i1.p1  ORF type:complete len:260 (-),score=68.41 TRINITY_DN26332_c0_g1_i1:110-787(-)
MFETNMKSESRQVQQDLAEPPSEEDIADMLHRVEELAGQRVDEKASQILSALSANEAMQALADTEEKCQQYLSEEGHCQNISAVLQKHCRAAMNRAKHQKVDIELHSTVESDEDEDTFTAEGMFETNMKSESRQVQQDLAEPPSEEDIADMLHRVEELAGQRVDEKASQILSALSANEAMQALADTEEKCQQYLSEEGHCQNISAVLQKHCRAAMNRAKRQKVDI